jgi:hypothetical protein
MPSTAAIFRRLALSLPDAFESAHMDHPDFRVVSADGKGRIFATLSGESKGLGVLKLTLEQQATFCEELPKVFEPVQGGWGRMGMTYVRLDAVEEDTLLGALTTAHCNVVAKLDAVRPIRMPSKHTAKKIAALAKPKMKL